MSAPICSTPQEADLDLDSQIYSNEPDWSRKTVDKYLGLINKLEHKLSKSALIELLKQSPGSPSWQSVYRAWRKYKSEGLSGLLAKYGHRAGITSVSNDLFEHFKALYLVEGSPSVKSCWLRVLGFAKKNNPQLDLKNFPSPSAFNNRLGREIPKEARYLARRGPSAWNKKYAPFVERNYDNILAGQCWVADHAQIDVCVTQPNGKPCFPWVTAFVDFKTTKWLGWLVHVESPNSDHIFQAFYYGSLKYGLCNEVYLDNGKDFRCHDFAGGRKTVCINVDESKTSSMLGLLGIVPHFALPYQAQSKIIERTFLKNKELFSKHMVGYRGGNTLERPEKLADEIKNGSILKIEDFIPLFDDFIINCLNKNSSQGKNLLGKSPDQLWSEEFTTKKTVSKEALKLFCMRSTGVVSIGRNGIYDSDLGQTYWGEWMSGMKGQKVYIRRDVRNYAEAWVFNAHNDECLGTARMGIFSAPALAKTEIHRQELKNAISAKRRATKITKAYANQAAHIDPFEQLTNLKAGIAAASGDSPEATPKIYHIANTSMDKIVRGEKKRKAQGTVDISGLVPAQESEIPLFHSEADQEIWLQNHSLTLEAFRAMTNDDVLDIVAMDTKIRYAG